MGTPLLAVIHCEPRIGWHGPFAAKMSAGLRALGVRHETTDSRERREGLPILLGTSHWRAIERTGPFLLVDRCSFGDTNQWVTLVRDGHGRRGDLRVSPGVSGARWDRYAVPVAPWRTGPNIVLCGQTETYSPRWSRLEEWYGSVTATHFRRHPAGDNPTRLTETDSWDDAGLAITLNSSVAVEAVLAGVPTVTMDESAMAWDVAGHNPFDVQRPDRTEWLHWLAWTQWNHDEIAEGTPWAHLL
jgi:hypothetical protein